MVIENGLLRVEIAAKGAELKSLTRQADAYQYLWNGDPKYWGKTSPILFPIVGGLKDDTYWYGGKSYHLSRHGFARDLHFRESQISDTSGIFTLADDSETRQVYPFAFQLQIRYELIEATLTCTYEVINPDAQRALLFSIGGHPAFATPIDGDLAYDYYYLEFPEDDMLQCHRVEKNLVTDSINIIPLDNHRLPLSHELFYADALVLKTLRSKGIALRNTKNDRSVYFSRENFPYFGIWAAKDANFVCLEPWYGIADAVSHTGLLEEKEGIQGLEPGARWVRSWSITCG